MKTTLAWIALGLMASGLAAAQAPQARIPTVPGAITSPPEWLTSPHFDIEKHFAAPPEAENAAPLYLDAIFEFSPDIASCFPWGEPERVKLAEPRMERLQALFKKWDDDQKSVTVGEIDECLAPLAEGFRKIELAQRRKSCVFAIGLDLDSILPHAQESRWVARALALKTHRDLARGDLKAAVGNVGMSLRLSRDLRPRGPAIVQLVSAAIDAVTIRWMIFPILRHPKLSAEECRNLIELLKEHRTKGLDLYRTGLEAESILVYSVIHTFETGRRYIPGPHGEPIEESDEEIDRKVAKAKAEGREVKGIDMRPVARSLARGRTDFDREYRLSDDFFETAFSVPPVMPSKQYDLIDQAVKRLLPKPEIESYRVVRYFLPHLEVHCTASASNRMYVGGGLCAAAVRLWRLTERAEPVDLAAVCRAAGIDRVPIDTYSLAPLRLTKIDGVDVIYSVGGDGRDDKGLIDSGNDPAKPGDYLFKLR